jgi:hypothetical protein
VLGSVLVLTPTGSVCAQGYNPAALVDGNNNECREVPNCLSVAMSPESVPARGRISRRFECPESNPYFWTWDVGMHEHIAAEQIQGDRKGPTIEATNHADTEGQFIVYLGCSTTVYDGAAVLVFRRLAPTGWVGSPARRPNAVYPPE